MMYNIWYSAKFKKDLKKVRSRGYDIFKIEAVIATLAEGDPLPEKYKDHFLTGNWAGFRECHIEPDWLLIYEIDGDALILTLTRTGTHSDLFD